MTAPLWQILRAIWRQRRRAMRRGLAMTVLTALAGIALLALSGWFIVAAGLAGVAGLGSGFDVFRPSAGVRFLAIARTGSRYGERLLTHDATLKALASLRVAVLANLSGADFATLARMRGGQALNRLTADVDALDGPAIRLVFPALAGALAAAATLAALAWLVTPGVAAWVAGSTLLGGLGVLAGSGRAAALPAAEAEARHQQLRAGVIDHLRGRETLALAGCLPETRQRLLDADRAARASVLRQATIEHRAAAALQSLAALSVAGTLVLSAEALRAGQIGAAQAALAIFAGTALSELAGGLLRGAADLGRMRDAARRIAPLLHSHRAPERPVDGAPGLQVADLSVTPAPGTAPVVSGFHLTVAPGETVALTGTSGRGKTTLLNTLAGLLPPASGTIARAARMGYLPQRPMLIAGSIGDALALAAPHADAALMDRVLAVCQLPLTRDHRIGEAGAGLSGGEARRLALARVLIRKPDLLLLDEPTEGLDAATAEAVLRGIRIFLPEAAIVIAAHRPAERRLADRALAL